MTRSINPEDARSFHLHLTTGGQRIDAMRSGTVEAAVDVSLGRSRRADAEATAAMLAHVAERLRAAFAEDAPPAVRATSRPRPRGRAR